MAKESDHRGNDHVDFCFIAGVDLEELGPEEDRTHSFAAGWGSVLVHVVNNAEELQCQEGPLEH